MSLNILKTDEKKAILIISTNSNSLAKRVNTVVQSRKDILANDKAQIMRMITFQQYQLLESEDEVEFQQEIDKMMGFLNENDTRMIVFDNLDIFPGIVHYKGNENYLEREKRLEYLHSAIDEYLSPGRFCFFSNSYYKQFADGFNHLIPKLGNTHQERVQTRLFLEKEQGKAFKVIKQKHSWDGLDKILEESLIFLNDSGFS